MMRRITGCFPLALMLLLWGLTPTVSAAILETAYYNGHTYYLLNNDSWTNSESQAQALGGHLATINDEAENSFVYNTFTRNGTVERHLWIGLNDAASEGNFVWASGEPVNYTNFYSGEPNNCCGGENYVHILAASGGSPYWNDWNNDAWGNWIVYGVVEIPGIAPVSGSLAIAAYSSNNSNTPGAGATAPTSNNPSFHADPVNVATGSHVLERSLLAVSGAQPIALNSRYDSLLLQQGPMGRGWGHNYETRLEILATNDIRIHWTANRRNTFVNDGSNNYSSTEGSIKLDRLIKNGDNSFTLTRKDGSILQFDATGKLIRQSNRIGQALNLSYGGNGKLATITEPVSGKALAFTYNSGGLINAVSDPLGRQVLFGYDGSNNLITITDPNNKATTYSYNSDGRVLTAVDAEGRTIFTNTYDSSGRVSTQDDSLASTTQLTAFNYDETVQPGAVTTTVTDRSGAIKVLTHDSNYNLIRIKDQLNNITSYTYDIDGNRLTATDPNGNVTSYSYDSRGNLVSITDPKSRVTTMAYDANDNLLTITDPAGRSVTYTYDANNRVLTAMNQLNQTTTYSYNSDGLPLTVQDPKGGVTTYSYTSGLLTGVTDPGANTTGFGYDNAGRRTSITSASGKTTTFAYDAADNLIKTTDPLGHFSAFTYDSHHNRLTAADPKGNVTTFSYNGNSKLLSIKNPLNQTTSFEYDAEDRVTKTIDARGKSISIGYDAAGRPTTTTDQLGNISRVQYDAMGNVLFRKDAYDTIIQTNSYDPQTYQPLTVKDALLNTVTYGYDTIDRITSITDPLNRVRQLLYDDLNRITQAVDPQSGAATQVFDENGNRTAQVDPNSNQTAFAFDAANRLTTVTTASGGANTLTYTKDKLTAAKNARNHTATFSYFDDGRVRSMADPAGTINYTYDANGNILTVTEGTKTLTYQYDLLNRVTRYTDGSGNVMQYAYDAVGNLITLTYPDGKAVSYTYDAANRMTTVTDWASRVTSYAYDKNGRLLTATRPDGSVESRRYDIAGNLLQLKDTKAGGATLISRYDYTYDAAGNITTETNAVVTGTITAPGAETMTYGPDNRLATYQEQSVSYDADGNMTTGPLGGAMPAFSYDARNRLTSVGATSYTYDAANNRTSQAIGGVTTRYVINPVAALSQALLEKDGASAVKAYYVYGLGLIGRQDGATGAYAVYHYDRRGSTVALTTITGATSDTYRYGPYGELVASTGNTVQPFKYNGRDGVMTDANGLYYMRARYYSPVVRRFVNMDTLLGGVDDGQTLNRYAYVNGMPVDMVDPSGMTKDGDVNTLVTSLVYDGLSGASASIFLGYGNNIIRTMNAYKFQNGLRSTKGMIEIRYRNNAFSARNLTNTVKVAKRLNDVAGGALVIAQTADVAYQSYKYVQKRNYDEAIVEQSKLLGSVLGGVAGSAIATTESVASLGAGVVVAPVIIVGSSKVGEKAGEYVGKGINSFIHNINEWIYGVDY